MRDRTASVKLIPFALIILLIFAAIQKCNSQSDFIKIIPDGEVVADSVYKTDSVGKNELYLRSKLWISSYFNSSPAVIDLDDKEAGIIIGKAISDIEVETAIGGIFVTHCRYTFKISVKENRFRIEAYGISYKNDAGYSGNVYIPSTETFPSTWFTNQKKVKRTGESYKQETYRALTNLFSSASSAISKATSTNDNW